jgi:hypothetical protein
MFLFLLTRISPSFLPSFPIPLALPVLLVSSYPSCI